MQEWKEGIDPSHFFTMDYSHIRRRRPIHNKSLPVAPWNMGGIHSDFASKVQETKTGFQFNFGEQKEKKSKAEKQVLSCN